MSKELKKEEVCEYCLGDGFITEDSCDHEGEHTQYEQKCECQLEKKPEEMKKLKVTKEWSKEDVQDFFSDFLNVDISNFEISLFRVSRDFEDSVIDRAEGQIMTEDVVLMGTGVEKFLKEIYNNIPNELK